MIRITQLCLIFFLTFGLAAAIGNTAMAAPGDAAQNQNRQMVADQHRYQTRTTAQQDRYPTPSGPVVGLDADQDRDRVKDGPEDGDPDRDRVRLQDRLMDCVDNLLAWLGATGSR